MGGAQLRVKELNLDQLSNHELLELLTLYSSDGAGHFMNFLTVFSAYLVAGYLAAGKLGKVTLISLSVLYVIVTAMTATGSVLTLSAAIDIANEVATRAISNASNLSPVAAILAGTAGQVSLVLNPLVQLLACACAGSIAFVFRHRSSTLI